MNYLLVEIIGLCMQVQFEKNNEDLRTLHNDFVPTKNVRMWDILNYQLLTFDTIFSSLAPLWLGMFVSSSFTLKCLMNW